MSYRLPNSVFLSFSGTMTTMDMIVGYESALEYWRTVGPSFLRGYRGRRDATRRARASLRSEEKLSLSEGNRRPAGCNLPLQVLVGTSAARTTTARVHSFACTELPEGSVVDAGEGFLVSTPEFCFLQMARRYSVGRLIQLGFELCGTYAVVEDGPARQRKAPLTSVAKLKAFLEAAKNVHGREKALRAVRYVLDGSASPMESVLVMLLCLPYKLGGYGLDRPQLNFRVDVPVGKRKLADRSYCKADLCWPGKSICVEYDSDLYHRDLERQESDARRRSTLAALDFLVITVTPGQVMDSGAFNRLAHQLAKLTGKRLRYVDPGFTHTHLELRAELFEAIGIGKEEGIR